MRKAATLITGANGEIGHGLIEALAKRDDRVILALDLTDLDKGLGDYCDSVFVGNILDESLLQRIVSKYEVHEIFHLAALLSTRAEHVPVQAQKVNVEGTINLLELAQNEGRYRGTPVKFLFPSSIAAYGIPDRDTKKRVGRIQEDQHLFPITMYGCNKLACEQLGTYYTFHYQQLAADPLAGVVDFRSLRFPGLISAQTIPTGGTSDYAPEMLHHAAQGKPYACFVDEGAAIPFMAMPDAIRSLLLLAEAPAEALTRRVYNIGAFSLTAGEIRERVLAAFPEADLSFAPDVARARIVDSWPADVDDALARHDWNWSHEYDVERIFSDYLLPGVKSHYGLTSER